MAWLEEHPTSGRFKICFRWGGRKLKKTVKTTSRKDAEALLRLEENISLLERGRIELPPGADIGTFLLSDGKVAQKPKAETAPKPITLGGLQDATSKPIPKVRWRPIRSAPSRCTCVTSPRRWARRS